MHNARPARLAPVIAPRETIAILAASAPATTLGIGAATMLDTGSFVSRTR